MAVEMRNHGDTISDPAESVLDFLECRPAALHPHLQREMLRSACDLLDHALMQHQVPAYPSGVTEQPSPVRSKR